MAGPRYPHGDGAPDRHTAELDLVAAAPDEDKDLIADPNRGERAEAPEAELARLVPASGVGKDATPLAGAISTHSRT